ncbi:MAG: hypothetical protein R3324_07725 [Halobacteriales archaeon]|nr:hypothetical protein [Halobacteriales archaeon]
MPENARQEAITIFLGDPELKKWIRHEAARRSMTMSEYGRLLFTEARRVRRRKEKESK